MSRFPKGQSGNPLGSSKGRRGRPPGQKPSTVVIWDLKMAARKHCPKALQRIAECLDDKDKRIRLMAAQIMLERGYGKPEQHADAEVTHNFCIAPQTMELNKWLANKGQPEPNEWLERQRAQAPTIDLKAEEPPEPESGQPLPPVDLSKLN
jgi:hypothetical protein